MPVLWKVLVVLLLCMIWLMLLSGKAQPQFAEVAVSQHIMYRAACDSIPSLRLFQIMQASLAILSCSRHSTLMVHIGMLGMLLAGSMSLLKIVMQQHGVSSMECSVAEQAFGLSGRQAVMYENVHLALGADGISEGPHT